MGKVILNKKEDVWYFAKFPKKYTNLEEFHQHYPDFKYGFHATDFSNVEDIVNEGLRRCDEKTCHTWANWEKRFNLLFENGEFITRRDYHEYEDDAAWEKVASKNRNWDRDYYEDDVKMQVYRDAFENAEVFFWNNWDSAVSESIRGMSERTFRKKKGKNVTVTHPIIVVHTFNPKNVDVDPENHYNEIDTLDPTKDKIAYYSLSPIEPNDILCMCKPTEEILNKKELYEITEKTWECFCKK